MELHGELNMISAPEGTGKSKMSKLRLENGGIMSKPTKHIIHCEMMHHRPDDFEVTTKVVDGGKGRTGIGDNVIDIEMAAVEITVKCKIHPESETFIDFDPVR